MGYPSLRQLLPSAPVARASQHRTLGCILAILPAPRSELPEPWTEAEASAEDRIKQIQCQAAGQGCAL
jgi:hypothetical protein